MLPTLANIQQAVGNQPLSDKDSLLAQLSDIQAPAPVGWWPPAPGWWLLAFLIVGSIYAIYYFTHKYITETRPRRAALALIKDLEINLRKEQLSQKEYINHLIAILKRCSISSYAHSRALVAGLYGEQYFQFLQASNRAGAGEINPDWYMSAYKKNPNIDTKALTQFAKNWVKHHKKLQRSQINELLNDTESTPGEHYV